MKIKLADRFLMVVFSVLLILSGIATVVLALFFKEINGIFTTTIWRIIGIAAGAVAVLAGLYMITFLRRYRYNGKQFIVMNTDSGEMRLSVKAVENQVKKCTDLHPEMRLEGVRVFNSSREGVTIKVKVAMASNISIPLAVASLQKQVKQYLMASSGLNVSEVKVEVDTMRGDANDTTPYRLDGEERKEEAAEEPVDAQEAPQGDEPVQAGDDFAAETEPDTAEAEFADDFAAEAETDAVNDVAEAAEELSEEMSALEKLTAQVAEREDVEKTDPYEEN